MAPTQPADPGADPWPRFFAVGPIERSVTAMPAGRREPTRSAERWNGPLWVWPAIGGVAAGLTATLLSQIRPREGWLAQLWPADTAAAATLLQLVATAAITVTTLTFSITVVALQLASQQYSPRLLRAFVRDPVIKAVLVVLTATFVYALTGLRSVHQDRAVPVLLCLGAALLGVASFAAVLGFTTHMVRTLRVDTMMLRVHDEAHRAMAKFYPDYGDESVRSPDELDLDAASGRMVTAAQSGYVRVVHVEPLLAQARERDLLIRIEIRAGDHVVRGAPVATVWTPDGRPAGHDTGETVRDAVVIGYERTLDQDAAFGLRQLEDIAVKAMSPGINDPVTASAAAGHMADLLVRLTGCRLGPTLHEDDDGVGRVVVPDRDLRYYLDLACGELRRFGASEPTVLMALLRMLRDVARSCRDDEQRAEVVRAADLVAGELSGDTSKEDAAAVDDLRRRVDLALEGLVHQAYSDRSGESRSM